MGNGRDTYPLLAASEDGGRQALLEAKRDHLARPGL